MVVTTENFVGISHTLKTRPIDKKNVDADVRAINNSLVGNLSAVLYLGIRN